MVLNYRHFLLCIYICFFSALLKAQEPLYIDYTVATGLPSNEIQCIFKDSKGYIWISTDKGVCRYNGSEFKVFTTNDGLGDNTNFQITEDRLGRIWFRGYNHFISYYQNGIFTKIQANNSIAENVKFDFINDFKLDKDLNLYLSIKNRTCLLKLAPPYVHFELVDFKRTEIGILQIDKNDWISISGIIDEKKDVLTFSDYFIDKKPPIVSDIEKKTLNANYNVDSKFIFNYTPSYTFVGINTVLFIKENGSKKSAVVTFKDKISALSFDSVTGNLLIGYANYGVDEYNVYSKKTKAVFNEKIPITNIIGANKEYWISTKTQGVIYIPNLHYNYFYNDSSTILSILPLADDSVLAFTIFGKTKIIKQKSISEIIPEGFEQTNYYWQKFNDNNDRYISYIGNMGYVLNKKNNSKIYFKNVPGQNENFATERIEFDDNNIYLSGFLTLMVMSKEGEFKYEGISKSRITSLFNFNNKLLIGTSKGLQILNGKKIEDIDTLSFLKNRVSCLAKTKTSKIIIGTRSNGIGIYDYANKKLNIINKKNGLENDFINDVKTDEEGNIWVVSNRCFSKISLHQNNTFHIINYSDIPIKQSTIQEIHFLGNDVFILANNSIIKFNKKDLDYKSEKYPFVIEQFNSNENTYSAKEDTLFELHSNENSLKFKYQLLAFSSNGGFEYSYKVNKNDWQYTTNNTLDFSNLKSGTYQFYFQGKVSGGEWSRPYAMTINIDAPFYAKANFLICLLLVIIFLIYLIVRIYIRKKIKQDIEELAINKKLEGLRLTALRAQMNPHFVFNVINSVQNFILKNEKMDAYKYLTDFSNLIRNYLDYSSKDVVPIQEEMSMINLYLSLEQLRTPFQYSVVIDDTIMIANTKIFTLMLQPFVENAIWHGLANKEGEKHIAIQLKKINEKIHISITDNGIGRKQAQLINKKRNSTTESFALKSMNNRIQSLNYLYDSMIEMEIVDNYNKEKAATGTTVNLVYEINKI